MAGPPEWHADKYEEAKRLITDIQVLIAARRAGNAVYMGQCFVKLEELAMVIEAIRTLPP